MKFKHLFLTVSVMALFTSCSNDELVSETTNHGDAIAFSVTTNNATRAHDYWCNSNLPNNFAVSAAYCDGTNTAFYFKDDIFKKDGETSNYVTNDGNYRYWPELPATTPEGTPSKYVNIYAYKIKDDAADTGEGFAKFEWTSATGAPTIEMTPATAAADQHDLLYAYTQVTAKPGYGDKTAINFRHALSQIVFEAKCENTKIYVEIEEIALMNAATSGTFTLPTGNNVTNANYTLHPSATGTVPATGLGSWKLNYTRTGDTPNRSYTASCLTADSKLTALAPGTTTWTNLTNNTDETAAQYKQSLLVLPQTTYTGEGAADNKLEAYDHTAALGNTGKCACVAIKCKIRNIAGENVVANDVYLWGDKDNAKDLVVPVDFNWEQGKKYIYRINFSKKGHGGYNPEDGKEVLVPIQLTVKVDDFAAVADSDATVKDI